MVAASDVGRLLDAGSGRSVLDALDAGRWWTRTQWTLGLRPLEHCGRWMPEDVDDWSGRSSGRRTQDADDEANSESASADAAQDAVGRWWT